MKNSKYFKYALGEVFLVMIGILLAFQVNQWKSNYSLKQEEIRTIQLLIRDLDVEKRNMKKFSLELKKDEETIINFYQAIMNNASRDTLISYYSRLNLWNYRPSKPTYEGLKQNGKLDIVKDQMIRDTIIGYFEELMPYLDDLRESNKIAHKETRNELLLYFGNSFTQEKGWFIGSTNNLESLAKDKITLHKLMESGWKRRGLSMRIQSLFLDETQKTIDTLNEYLTKLNGTT